MLSKINERIMRHKTPEEKIRRYVGGCIATSFMVGLSAMQSGTMNHVVFGISVIMLYMFWTLTHNFLKMLKIIKT